MKKDDEPDSENIHIIDNDITDIRWKVFRRHIQKVQKWSFLAGCLIHELHLDLYATFTTRSILPRCLGDSCPRPAIFEGYPGLLGGAGTGLRSTPYWPCAADR